MSSAGAAFSKVFAHVKLWEVGLGVGIFVISLVGSGALAAFVLCRLPEDYLVREHDLFSDDSRPRFQRVLLAIGKNILALLLIVLGVVLSLPGVPGQGILTILLGVMLLDVPGKREFERRIMSRPSVFRNINRLRQRFGKQSLMPAEERAKEALSAAHR